MPNDNPFYPDDINSPYIPLRELPNVRRDSRRAFSLEDIARTHLEGSFDPAYPPPTPPPTDIQPPTPDVAPFVEELPCDCPRCGASVPMTSIVETAENQSACRECTIECENCGRVHTDNSNRIANAYTTARPSTYAPQSTLCDRCAFVCGDCDERFAADVESARNPSGRRICGRCAESYNTCDSCQCIHSADDSNYLESSDQTLCNSCYREREARDNRRESIHDYSYKPRASFHRTADEGGITTRADMRRYFGIEVEVESSDGDESDMADSADNVASSGLFYCKDDGSITEGFEIVSHPATLAYWRGAALECFNALRRDGYRSYKTSTCGMHIHVSRAALSSLDQIKLLLFFRHNPTFIHHVSRRTAERLNQWAQIDDQPTNGLVHKVKNGNRHSARYTAINFENSASIEFRIFRGTIDIGALKRNIEFLNALIEYVKVAGLKEMKAHLLKRWVKTAGKCIIGKSASKTLTEWFNKFPQTIDTMEV